jgi:hypothetical protein
MCTKKVEDADARSRRDVTDHIVRQSRGLGAPRSGALAERKKWACPVRAAGSNSANADAKR